MRRSLWQYRAVFIIAIALFGLQLGDSERMLIIEAGVDGKKGPYVQNGMRFCPKTFSTKGFSIVCIELDGPVEFQLNGMKVRIENHPPYTITGDLRGNIRAWNSYPSKATITCIPKTGPSLKATIQFSCAKRANAPFALPIAKHASPHGRRRRRPRSFIGPTPPPAKKSNCVVINSINYISKLSPGWTVDGTAVIFEKDGGDYEGIVSGNTAPLEYYFVPPATATYAITLDFESQGYTTHNDLWVRCPTGLNLRSGRHVIRAQTGYVKVFHNRNGRAVEAYSLNFDRWSLSTATGLRRGRPYRIFIGGRSTEVTLHRIILFPCSGMDCQYRSRTWIDGVQRCK